jgi:hypothetical protein
MRRTQGLVSVRVDELYVPAMTTYHVWGKRQDCQHLY